MKKMKFVLWMLTLAILTMPQFVLARSNVLIKPAIKKEIKQFDEYWMGTEAHIWNTNIGNVGIGTGFYPNLAKLTVAGNVSASAYRIGLIDVITDKNIFRADKGTTDSPAFSFYENPNTGMFSPVINNLAFSLNGQEKLRITPEAKLGLGTTNPQANLHVMQEDVSNSYNDNVDLILESASAQIELISQNGQANVIRFRNSLGGDGDISYNYFLDGHVPKYRMDFNSMGGFSFNRRVGILTDTPSADLHVNGSIRGQYLAQNGQLGLTKSYSLKDTTGFNCQMHFVSGLLVESNCLEISLIKPKINK